MRKQHTIFFVASGDNTQEKERWKLQQTKWCYRTTIDITLIKKQKRGHEWQLLEMMIV